MAFDEKLGLIHTKEELIFVRDHMIPQDIIFDPNIFPVATGIKIKPISTMDNVKPSCSCNDASK